MRYVRIFGIVLTIAMAGAGSLRAKGHQYDIKLAIRGTDCTESTPCKIELTPSTDPTLTCKPNAGSGNLVHCAGPNPQILCWGIDESDLQGGRRVRIEAKQDPAQPPVAANNRHLFDDQDRGKGHRGRFEFDEKRRQCFGPPSGRIPSVRSLPAREPNFVNDQALWEYGIEIFAENGTSPIAEVDPRILVVRSTTAPLTLFPYLVAGLLGVAAALVGQQLVRLYRSSRNRRGAS